MAWGRCGPALAGLSLVGAAAAISAAEFGMMARVQPGAWRLHEVDGAAPDRTICVADPMRLLQIRHGAAACARFVLDSDARRITIHYTCPEAGHGRTTLTIESDDRLRISTQGVADRLPFAFDYQAHRTGACVRTAAAR